MKPVIPAAMLVSVEDVHTLGTGGALQVCVQCRELYATPAG